MYHYVRLSEPELPYFKYLHIEDFVKQLDYFGNEYGFISKESFRECLVAKEPAHGVILTFDDGFKDHYHYVLPELTKRNLWGIFFVPTAPYSVGEFIDVHRIHLLLGKHGGKIIADAINKIITEKMLSHVHVHEFRQETYVSQKNDEATKYVKRLLNYFIDYQYRKDIINELMSIYYPGEDELLQDFYMTKKEVRSMHQRGMVIGSHTVNHPVMSKLSIDEQEREIELSFQVIESITGDNSFKTFCYPYGGFHTFTSQTESILNRHSCVLSFNVEPRNISTHDLAFRPQALPRFDCNAFPFGECRSNE